MSKLAHSNDETMLEIDVRRMKREMSDAELAAYNVAGVKAAIALGKKVTQNDPLLWWMLTEDLALAAFDKETQNEG